MVYGAGFAWPAILDQLGELILLNLGGDQCASICARQAPLKGR